ncbi:MAG: lactate utilization protein [Endomicrobiales bacterium]|nr:lactate utilization protein [Endomicrobiales bacterium]
MDKNLIIQSQNLLNSTVKALEKNNFTVFIFENAAAATAKILELVHPTESVGSGGSMTLGEMGILQTLKERGNNIIVSTHEMSFEEMIETRRKALLANVFIGSPNAVTTDGKLVFVDKIGNRVGGMTFGPQKVIAVAGINKIVQNEEAAFERVRLVAGPANAVRLKLKTPCAQSGICSDCNSSDRICNIKVVLSKKPAYTQYFVLLVAQELGY